jgi:hypothetical protein
MATTRIVTVPGVRPVFQVAAGDDEVQVGQAVYDTARYDDYPAATYGGLDAPWMDDSCDVLEAVTWYGRQRTSDVFDVGTATITVANPDGLWDYPPTADPPPTAVALRPGRAIRIGVAGPGGDPVAWLWRGWIDATQPAYDPTAGPSVTVNCVCAKGEWGRVDTVKLAAPVGAGESATARVGRIADAADVPAAHRLFDEAGTTLIGTQLGGRVTSLWDRAAQSSGGDLAGDNNGFVRYFGKDWQAWGAGSDPDGLIGNRGLPGEVCPNGWEQLFARSEFTDRVLYGRAGEDARPPLNDLADQGRYRIETFTMTGLETAEDAELDNLAARILRVRSFDLAPRIAACTVDAARPGVVALLKAASPFRPSRYVCALVVDGRAVFTRNLYLTGIEHTITPARWTARLALDDATPWMVPAESRYDAAHYNTDRYSRIA